MDPGLAVKVETCTPALTRADESENSGGADSGYEIVVSCEHYAKGIEIRNESDDLVLSDNFFDMNGGEKRVRVIKGDPTGVSVRSVWSIR